MLLVAVLVLQSCATSMRAQERIMDDSFSNRIFFQDSLSTEERQKEAVHLVKISPQRLLNYFQPGIELSYEVRTAKRWATQFTAGYMYPVGYRGAIEEKFYLLKNALFGPYLSLGVDYQQNRFARVIEFKDVSRIPDSTYNDLNLPDSLLYQDSVSIHRQIFNANVKFGYQFYHKQWCFDIYAGLGYRYRKVVFHRRINPEDKELTDYSGGGGWDPLDDGEFSVPNFTLGFRVGYIFPTHKYTVKDNFD